MAGAKLVVVAVAHISIIRISLLHKHIRSRLVELLNNSFLVFKQHYTHFYTLFHPHVFQKNTIILLKLFYQTGHKCNHFCGSSFANPFSFPKETTCDCDPTIVQNQDSLLTLKHSLSLRLFLLSLTKSFFQFQRSNTRTLSLSLTYPTKPTYIL